MPTIKSESGSLVLMLELLEFHISVAVIGGVGVDEHNSIQLLKKREEIKIFLFFTSCDVAAIIRIELYN